MMKFILTIDTEGDDQWNHGRDVTSENVKYIPRFQDLCDKYNVRPTYLVTSEICEDGFAKELFSGYISSGRAEIGAHLHSWTTPPFMETDGYRYNDSNHTFAHELPLDLLGKKIKQITDQVEASFGEKPRSFRSGRYGFNESVAKILVDNHYLVDSSITPFVDWSANKGLPGGSGGVDFMNYDPFPFSFNFNGKELLEIPNTLLPTRFPLNRSKTLAKLFFRNVDKNILLRTCRKLFYPHQPLWLRPYIWMDEDLMEEIIQESARISLPFLVMMFHSSELMPGCSKYRPNDEAVEKLYNLLEHFFIKLRYRKLSSVTLTEAAKSHL